MNQTEQKPSVTGQAPLSPAAVSWILTLILLWAGNSVLIKVVVRDIPPFWAAFLRFGLSLPFVAAFLLWRKAPLRLGAGETGWIAVLGLMSFLQIASFNTGSQYTTGGRITLFIFSYPLFVPLIAARIVKYEQLSPKTLAGCAIAFLGLAVALRTSLFHGGAVLKGDLLELFSCIILAAQIALNKRLIYTIDKWKIMFWRYVFSVVLFAGAALLFERFDPAGVRPGAWAGLAYQVLVVSVFCFLSFQYILSRHNSSRVSVFFFATPLFGMTLGVLLLGEPFDAGLCAGGVLVGLGIYIANRHSG